MKDDCLHIELNELSELLNCLNSSLDSSPRSNETQNQDSDNSLSSDDCIYIGNSEVLDEDIHNSKNLDEVSLTQIAQQALKQDLFNSKLNYLDKFEKNSQQPYSQQLYSTPPQTSPAALLAAMIQESEDSEPIEAFHLDSQNQECEVWKAAFNAE